MIDAASDLGLHPGFERVKTIASQIEAQNVAALALACRVSRERLQAIPCRELSVERLSKLREQLPEVFPVVISFIVREDFGKTHVEGPGVVLFLGNDRHI